MPNYPYYNPYAFYQPMQTQQTQMPNMPQSQPQQIQNGGFVSVPNEEIARNYPVALGNSITFKDESAPYIYTKTMGFSQLDVPKFDKYRLVKEEPNLPQIAPKEEEPIKLSNDNFKAEFEAIWNEIEGIKSELHKQPAQPITSKKKKEVTINDADAES